MIYAYYTAKRFLRQTKRQRTESMQITKREFLKKLGLGGAAFATGAAFGDEYVPDKSRLPEGSCGDPQNVWFGKPLAGGFLTTSTTWEAVNIS